MSPKTNNLVTSNALGRKLNIFKSKWQHCRKVNSTPFAAIPIKKIIPGSLWRLFNRRQARDFESRADASLEINEFKTSLNSEFVSNFPSNDRSPDNIQRRRKNSNSVSDVPHTKTSFDSFTLRNLHPIFLIPKIPLSILLIQQILFLILLIRQIFLLIFLIPEILLILHILKTPL